MGDRRKVYYQDNTYEVLEETEDGILILGNDNLCETDAHKDDVEFL